MDANATSVPASGERLPDRVAAGRALAQRLQAMALPRPVVLALPRGGVPVAVEIARVLRCPLDVLLVRKLGAPGFAELGLGAVVEGDPPQRVLNERVMERLRPSPQYLDEEERRQLALIAERRQRLRQGRPPEPVGGRTAVLVDDGIATGGTMRAALQAVRRSGAARVVVAVPVAPPEAASVLGLAPEDWVCLLQPQDFESVGLHYQDFEQVREAEVVRALEAARRGTGDVDEIT